MTFSTIQRVALAFLMLAAPALHADDTDYFKCAGRGGTDCALRVTTVPGSFSKYHQEYEVTYDFTSCGSADRPSTLYITAKERVIFDLWYKRRDTQPIKGFELYIVDTDPNWTLGEMLGSSCKLKLSWTSQLSEEAKSEFDTETEHSIKTMSVARQTLADNASYQTWSKRIASDPDTWAGRLKDYIAELRASGKTETAANLEDVLLGDATLGQLQKTEMRLVCLAKKVLDDAEVIQNNRIESTYGKHEDLQTKINQLKTTIGARICDPSVQ